MASWSTSTTSRRAAACSARPTRCGTRLGRPSPRLFPTRNRVERPEEAPMRPLLSRVLPLTLVPALAWGCADAPTSPRLLEASLTATTAAPADGALAGQLLAFASTRDQGLFQVFVIQENGLRPRQLTTLPAYNARPNWSHDGRRITFTSCRPTDSSCEIYVMNAD